MSSNSINSPNTNTAPLSDAHLLGGGASAPQVTPSNPLTGPQFSVFFERMMHPSFAQSQPSNSSSPTLNASPAATAPSLPLPLPLDSSNALLNSSPSSLGGLPLANFLGGSDLSALSGTSAFGGLGNSSSSSAFAPTSNNWLGSNTASMDSTGSLGSTSWARSQPSSSSSTDRSNAPDSRTNTDPISNNSTRDEQTASKVDTSQARQPNRNSADTPSHASDQRSNAHEHLQRREQSSGAALGDKPKSTGVLGQDPNAPLDSNLDTSKSILGATQDTTVDTLANSPNSPSSDAASGRLTLANIALSQQRLPSVSSTASNASTAASAMVSDPGAASGANALASTGSNPLITVALGDNTQIVTVSSDAPNEKSLADFARSMGFDESAISELFGPDANALMLNAAALQAGPLNTSTLNTGTNAAAALSANSVKAGLTLTTNADSLATLTLSAGASSSANTLASAQTANSAAMLTSNSLGTALNPLSHLPVSSQAIGALGNTPVALSNPLSAGMGANGLNNLLQSSAGSPLVTNPTNPNTANTAISDMNDLLEQAGVNTLEAKISFSTQAATSSRLNSTMSGNAASTLSVLNMAGSNLSSSAIETLQTAFNQLNGKGTFSTGDTKAFDLALGTTAALAGNDPSLAVGATLDLSGQGAQSGAGSNANTGSPIPSDASALSQNPLNMADTYEQLSNQLASELSKRMNDQIAQGQWKMKFALKPSSLGAVDVSLEMKDGKLAAVLQSDNALTQNLLQHGSQQLKDNLSVLGLNHASVQIGQGSAGGSHAQGQGSGNEGQNPFANNSQNASSVNDLTQDSSTVADAPITGKSNDALLDTFA